MKLLHNRRSAFGNRNPVAPTRCTPNRQARAMRPWHPRRGHPPLWGYLSQREGSTPRCWHCLGAPGGPGTLPRCVSSAPQNPHKSGSAEWFPTESPRTKLLSGRSRVRVAVGAPSGVSVVSPPACGNAGREGTGMTQAPPASFKIPTKSPQPARGKAARPAPGRVLATGTGRAATRGGGEVIELEHGITVYPAREEPGRWRQSGTRTASGSSARRPARRSCPPGWRRSPSGWRTARRT